MAAIEHRNSVLPNKQTREEMIAKEKEKLSQRMNFDLENIEKQLREFTSKKKTRPFFPWKLYFAEVFEKGGFDIVIGNPPYVLLQGVNRDKKLLQYFKDNFTVASYKVDLYHLFIEKGIRLLNNCGCISYITPSNYTSNNYAAPLRRFMLTETALKSVTFFEEDVFEANVNNSVFVAIKSSYNNVIFYKASLSGNVLSLETSAI